ncbi:MAG TPA: AraC family transcriptional regulator [Polyangiaceae bacterium]|nr:AraC family transcriptional regulator [Polyangiaceae bacterium]
MMEVVDAQQPWRRVSAAYELLCCETWRGELVCRGARRRLEPGALLWVGPGESFEMSGAGSFRVLSLEPELWRRAQAERGLSLTARQLEPWLSSTPGELGAELRRVLDELRADSAPSLEALFDALESELSGASDARRLPAHAAPVAVRLRELLLADEEQTRDLEQLAQGLGFSRFQLLRAFKRAYGLPPHTYVLCARIAQAQRLLRLGQRPAYVAAELGFADQSHLTRHFKRLLRVTPSEYAQATLSRPPRQRSIAG